jgi:hypothetical protein
MLFIFTYTADRLKTKKFRIRIIALLVAVLINSLDRWSLETLNKLLVATFLLGTD